MEQCRVLARASEHEDLFLVPKGCHQREGSCAVAHAYSVEGVLEGFVRARVEAQKVSQVAAGVHEGFRQSGLFATTYACSTMSLRADRHGECKTGDLIMRDRGRPPRNPPARLKEPLPVGRSGLANDECCIISV